MLIWMSRKKDLSAIHFLSEHGLFKCLLFAFESTAMIVRGVIRGETSDVNIEAMSTLEGRALIERKLKVPEGKKRSMPARWL